MIGVGEDTTPRFDGVGDVGGNTMIGFSGENDVSVENNSVIGFGEKFESFISLAAYHSGAEVDDCARHSCNTAKINRY